MARANVPDASLQQIVVHGDPEELIKRAKEIGEALAGSLKTSQIRNIYGTVRGIQMSWPPMPQGLEEMEDIDREKWQRAATQGWRQLLLLIPKLRYQAGRIKDVRPLADVLEEGIRLVDRDRTRFQYFAEFFEAILAYHTAADSKSQKGA